MVKAQTDESASLKANERKWSKELMEAGWTVFRYVLIERQKARGLTPFDINILLHLAAYWWTPEGKPFPSKNTLAEAMGVTPRAVQRRIAGMEKAGLIKREERRLPGVGSKTNIYHLDGLIENAKPLAQEMVENRKEKTKDRERIRAKKGKPKLALVKSTP